jgi:hypothetical protein
MTLEDVLLIVEQAVEPRQLNKIQKLILQYSWQGHSYDEIAKATGYDGGYIKDTGSKLWQMLSNSFGEKIHKQNCQAVLKRYCRQQSQPATTPKAESLQPSQDWGEAIDTSIFYGRSREVTTLNEWIVRDKCRLIAVLGMGGVGKTTLSVKVTEEVQEEFECLFWRSLRDATPLDELLTDLLQFLSQGESAIPSGSALRIATTESGKLSQLLEYLRLKRCLIVLDNFDSVFASGQRVGIYREGYESYGELLKRVGEIRHKSCMVVTSRDKPSEIAILRGASFPVREMPLRGLEAIAANKLLIDKGLQGSQQDLERLIECYQGNPLALKITATSICDLFDGCVADFLKQKVAIFNGIRYLLKQQIDRLCVLEEQVMYWLAINRESVGVEEIQADLVSSLSLGAILEILESLRSRSLVEKTAEGFTQQPVVLEYMTELLIDRICSELINSTEFQSFGQISPLSPQNLAIQSTAKHSLVSPTLFLKGEFTGYREAEMITVRGFREQNPLFLNRYAILKATSKDYIRDSQKRTIVEPIIKSAIASLGCKEALVTKLKQLLKQFRIHQLNSSNYAIGNLLNLFNYLEVDDSMMASQQYQTKSIKESFRRSSKKYKQICLP